MVNHVGRLLILASTHGKIDHRLESVSSAAKRVAKLLKSRIEFVDSEEEFEHIYVYYANGHDEPIPIYCDKGREYRTKEIYRALAAMIFVLSFHPEYPGLKSFRKEVMRFS